MKEKEVKKVKSIKATNNVLLTSAGEKLSGKLLFREKVQAAKAYLRDAKFSDQA